MVAKRRPAGTAPLFAVAAEFTSPEALLHGVQSMRPRGLGVIETYTPIPIAGLSEAMGVGGSIVRFAVVGIVLGFAATMGMCIYATAVDYVFDIGGRPLVSWPAFVVPSVSFAALAGALAIYLAMLVTNRLPRLNHPAFNIPNFTRASQDRFFLTIEPKDDAPLDLPAIDAALGGLADRPVAVVKVPR